MQDEHDEEMPSRAQDVETMYADEDAERELCNNQRDECEASTPSSQSNNLVAIPSLIQPPFAQRAPGNFAPRSRPPPPPSSRGFAPRPRFNGPSHPNHPPRPFSRGFPPRGFHHPFRGPRGSPRMGTPPRGRGRGRPPGAGRGRPPGYQTSIASYFSPR